MAKYLVTGATGQLGRLVLSALENLVPRDDIAVLVRTPEASAEFAARGVDPRMADYKDGAGLKSALAGIERLLLISGSEIGQRIQQHQNVIDAARANGVTFLAYTSVLRASESPMALAVEHKATEEALAASGLAYAFLRNGWYTENHLGGLPQMLAMGQQFGAAGDGLFSTAPRQDYAEAAAAVLAGEGHEGKVYELAGDSGYSLAQFAALVAELSGKDIAYTDMPQAAFAAALTEAGLPEGFAAILADSDAHAGAGWLESRSDDLSRLIGRPTTPLNASVAAALAAM